MQLAKTVTPHNADLARTKVAGSRGVIPYKNVEASLVRAKAAKNPTNDRANTMAIASRSTIPTTWTARNLNARFFSVIPVALSVP